MKNSINTKKVEDSSHLDMMIAIKTLGLDSDSIITSIGAVLFDRTGKTNAHLDKKNQFYVSISNFDSSVHGFNVNPKTIAWLKQNKYLEHLSPEIMNATTPLKSGLESLINFIEEKKPSKYFANSPRFHFTYFEGVCEKMGIPFKFDRHKEADFRSIMDVFYPNRSDRPPHDERIAGYPIQHALGDAIMQSVNLINVLCHPALQPRSSAKVTEEDTPEPKPRRMQP